MKLFKLKAKDIGHPPKLPDEARAGPSRRRIDPLRLGPAHIAHRGLHGPHVPENSLAAFKAAVEVGAGIECDLRLSLDDEVMVFHDADLTRMCGVDGQIETMRAADLAKLRLLGGDEHIPTLRELLVITRDEVPLMLELKTRNGNFARLTSRMADAIGGCSGRVAVLSGDPLVGLYLALTKPSIRRGFPVSGRNSRLVRALKLLLARPQFLVVKAEIAHQLWIRRMRSSVPVYAWTIRNRATWDRVVPHVDGLIWEWSAKLTALRGAGS